ncbi:MAG: 4-(cytidine 5'-diphospho)-2-C-methyl-D-erythritol kinase [Gammaproteobacteria bacterium]|nr:4-(cytidine 5'-diphospho)-2-C-methyl-D-erythritol kinase [Gammaproteobacteria bacterium]
MSSLQLPAPAKLNLILRVLGRRTDGYHQLQTLFQLLDYGDSLHFSVQKSAAIEVDCKNFSLKLQDNLVYRAARLLQQHTNCPKGVHIQLQKKIPLGGGLGGGSSDAATTLLGLNSLWQCGLNTEQLAQLGGQLGADVPVFVHGHSAWAEGVGELLTPVTITQKYYVVLLPDCHISTTELFSHPDLTRDSSPITFALLRGKALDSDWLAQYAGNDFQPLVEHIYPQIRSARQWLEQFSQAYLSGSGSCVFAAFDSHNDAHEVIEQIPKPLSGFVATGVNHSPAHRQLAQSANTNQL